MPAERTVVRRVAMAALDGPAALSQACGELGSGGFDRRQLSIMGTVDVIDGLRQAGLADPGRFVGIVELVRDVAPLPLVAGAPVVATAGSFLAHLKALGAAPGQGTSGTPGQRCWLEPGARAQVLDGMQQGNVWLLASAGSHEQWVEGTRLLMRVSHHPVYGIIR